MTREHPDHWPWRRSARPCLLFGRGKETWEEAAGWQTDRRRQATGCTEICPGLREREAVGSNHWRSFLGPGTCCLSPESVSTWFLVGVTKRSIKQASNRLCPLWQMYVNCPPGGEMRLGWGKSGTQGMSKYAVHVRTVFGIKLQMVSSIDSS